MADYLMLVTNESERARDHIEIAMSRAPNDVEVLRRASRIASDRHDTETALALLDRARTLDPRSVSIAQTRLFALVRHGRYTDAIQAGEAARALKPDDLQSIQFHTVAYLALGDLAGARRVIRESLAHVPAPALVVQLAGFFEMTWALEPAEHQLVFRLSRAAFDNDVAWWGQSLATAYWDSGDRVRARAYADSALATTYAQLQDSPDNGQSNALYGLMLAYTGRRDDALRHGRAGLAAAIEAGDAPQIAYTRVLLVRIHLVFDELDAAAAEIEALVQHPHQYSAAWLRLDPMFRPLRGHGRFEATLARLGT
jgi:tetratricopeptide (TPR) repeat protein